MPFGHNCEHPNFDACVRTMTGKVEKPLAFCASLMRETEAKCRQRRLAIELPIYAWLDVIATAHAKISLQVWRP